MCEHEMVDEGEMEVICAVDEAELDIAIAVIGSCTSVSLSDMVQVLQKRLAESGHFGVG